MKHLVLLGLLLAGCAAPPGPTPPSPVASATPTPVESTAPAGWNPYTAPDGSFTILLPGPAELMDDEGGFEVSAQLEPGPRVEIDCDRFPSAKVAAQKHEEKIKDAKAGKVKSEHREGNRVVLELQDKQGAPFLNAIVLAGDQVIDVVATGAPDDMARAVDSLKVKAE